MDETVTVQVELRLTPPVCPRDDMPMRWIDPSWSCPRCGESESSTDAVYTAGHRQGQLDTLNTLIARVEEMELDNKWSRHTGTRLLFQMARDLRQTVADLEENQR